MKILDDVRVVECSAFIAAPLGGLTLAQMGADVVRLDPPGGGPDHDRAPLAESGASFYWSGLNKGKRSVVIDTRTDQGRALATDLITAPGPDAGIFVTNLPARGWMSYESLSARRPDLIMVEITGNRDGSTAVDYTVNAATGLPDMTRMPEGTPLNNAFPCWDALAALYAALGIVAALGERRSSGQGAHIRLALSDVALAMMGHVGHLGQVQVTGTARPALGNEVYGGFGGDFETADNRRIMVVTVTDRQWRALVEATSLEAEIALAGQIAGSDLDSNAARYEARDLLTPIFARWARARPLAQIAQTFEAHRVCWGPFQSVQQLIDDDPRCSTTNPLFGELAHAGIPSHLTPGLPLEFAAHDRTPPRPSRPLGADTGTVLADALGLSESALEDLRAAGIIAPDAP